MIEADPIADARLAEERQAETVVTETAPTERALPTNVRHSAALRTRFWVAQAAEEAARMQHAPEDSDAAVVAFRRFIHFAKLANRLGRDAGWTP